MTRNITSNQNGYTRYDFVLEEGLQRPISADLQLNINGRKKPLVLFVHGFKGFKDWGHFNLLARYFADNGFAFAKLNLSHNGTTPDNLTDLSDLEAFAENNFSKELSDIRTFTGFLLRGPKNVPSEEINTEKVFIIGHSRGGSVAIIAAAEDARISAAASWAAVSNLEKRWSKTELETWQKTGVEYIANTRTGQQLPMKYQIVEDYYANRERFNILNAAKKLKEKLLIIHGDADESVPAEMAAELKNANTSAQLILMPGCNHSFGGSHPFAEETLPADAQQAADFTIRFFQQFL